ncbi:transcription antitermination factor NusB, partial [Nonomuraea wenchangensis]|uniref:transcription antitermination factor NusB n=1 Tax=Nonomuraea wenchangensis TaxID=568860 RepID=UPI003329F2CE
MTGQHNEGGRDRPGGGAKNRAGKARDGQSQGGQPRGGQPRSGQARGGESHGGQSGGGQARGGESRGGQSGGGQPRGGQARGGQGRPGGGRGGRRVPRDEARIAAFDVIRAVDERDSYANLLLPRILRDRGIRGRDAALATELAYGTLRGLGTYDAIIEMCSDRAPDPDVRDALRLGAHQLLRMRVPP